MIFTALSEAADRQELLLVANGLCRFHRRKDGVVVIREIMVLPDARRLGIGRRMVEEIQRRHAGAKLLAKCPASDYTGAVGSGNAFWRHMGFVCKERLGSLNTWERQP